MSRLFLYAHGGSGNHGCEAIVRSTAKILGIKPILISSNPEEDRYYGLHEFCNVTKDVNDAFSKFSLDFIKAYVSLKLCKDYVPMDKLRYKDSFSSIKKGDLALSIGGDNYCYADVGKYIMLHDMLRKRGAKTVLWGCSVEPEVAKRPEIIEDIKRYDLITARESITYSALKRINPNTELFPDSAFYLEEEKTKLPVNFIEGNTVGFNLSPMVIDLETISGTTLRNYERLIDWILSDTDMNIALIPHVVWDENDDRKPLNQLFDRYKESERVCLIKDQNCSKLKYVISKCRFFVGARTHSTIAAYSSCAPTLVLGYSVKSKGIARDLFGEEEHFTVDVHNLEGDDILLNKFKYIYRRETEIKQILIQKNYFFSAQRYSIAKCLNNI